jgi:DNA-binding transcriptional ArsR family regulator
MTEPPVDAIFTALSDATRRSVIQLLSGGDANATEIAGQLPVSRQAVTKHLVALSEAGLVSSEREGRENRYHLTPAPLQDAVSWMAEVGAGWDGRLDALQKFVQRQDD